MQANFKKAEAGDTQTLIDLLSALYVELGEEASSLEWIDGGLVEKIIGSGHTDAYLIQEKAKTLGVITLTLSQSIYAGGDYLTIDEMYILPPYRSNKLGHQAIQFAKQVAVEKNCRRLVVTTPTSEEFERTIAFYRSSGFEFTGNKMKIIL